LSTIIDEMAEGDPTFSDKLGVALSNFFKLHDITEAKASRSFGMPRATLNTYTAGVNGGRKKVPAEVLVKACLLGFEFEFDGYLIVATKDGQRVRAEEKQLHLEFTREVDLGENGRTVAVGLKKPPGRIALTVSLREVS
jgi:hypothetical protein